MAAVLLVSLFALGLACLSIWYRPRRATFSASARCSLSPARSSHAQLKASPIETPSSSTLTTTRASSPTKRSIPISSKTLTSAPKTPLSFHPPTPSKTECRALPLHLTHLLPLPRRRTDFTSLRPLRSLAGHRRRASRLRRTVRRKSSTLRRWRCLCRLCRRVTAHRGGLAARPLRSCRARRGPKEWLV